MRPRARVSKLLASSEGEQDQFRFRRAAIPIGYNSIEELLLVGLGLKIFAQGHQHGDVPAAQHENFRVVPQLPAFQRRGRALSEGGTSPYFSLASAKLPGVEEPRLAILFELLGESANLDSQLRAVFIRQGGSWEHQHGGEKHARQLSNHDSAPLIKISIRRFSAARGSALFLRFLSA